MIQAPFSAGVEALSPYLQRLGGDLPQDFLKAWLTKESGGQACSIGVIGVEAGYFQTWHPDDDIFGQTYSQLRTVCPDPTSQAQSRPQTEDEKIAGINAGLRYVRDRVNRARATLASVGADWDESQADFGMMVKLIHGAGPTGAATFLRSATQNLGRPPETFAELIQANTVPDPHGTLGNAVDVGKFWTGMSATTGIILIIGAATAYAVYQFLKRRKR